MKEENAVLQTFINKEFGEIRTIIIDGEIWFVGKDVATALGYSNPRKTLADHIDKDDKKIINLNTVTIRYGIVGNPNAMLINESGLYSLVLSSKLPTAKKFKHWVTAEVLPSIRKTGAYGINDLKGRLELAQEIRRIAAMTSNKDFRETLLHKVVFMLIGEEL